MSRVLTLSLAFAKIITVCWEMSLKLGQFLGWEESAQDFLLFSSSCLVFILWLLFVMNHLTMVRKDGCWPVSSIVQGAPGQLPSGLANGCLMILDIITFGVFPIQSMLPWLVFS